MVGVAAVIAMLLFIYINRSLQKRRMNRRISMNERREEYMRQFFTAKKKMVADKGDETGRKRKMHK